MRLLTSINKLLGWHSPTTGSSRLFFWDLHIRCKVTIYFEFAVKCWIMISLKLLYCSPSILHSCSIITQRRIPVVFVRTRTLCSVSSRSVSSRHASERMNCSHWTNTSDQAVSRRYGTVRWFSAAPASSGDIMNVFDRNTKRKQRNQTAHLPNYNVYDYLKDEVC